MKITLFLLSLDISDLGCIGECTNLERLDLSRNDISKLFALAGLSNISYLNLSGNRITSLGKPNCFVMFDRRTIIWT